MGAFLDQMSFSDPIVMAVGATLLLFGRRLYWLALGGLGFFLAQHLAQQDPDLARELQLGLAILGGVVGIVLAIVARKVAVTIGGFAIGAILAYSAALPWAADLDTGIWWITFLGAVLGVCFAAFLFKAALVLVSAAVGAMLVISTLPLDQTQQMWAFAVLALVGAVVQFRGKQAPKDDG